MGLIVNKKISYMHFGITCSPWAGANTLNNGTRRKHCPEGDGTLERERAGNRQADRVVELCILGAKHGTHFSIENPHGSHLFMYSSILHLLSTVQCFEAIFDQCRFGLTLEDALGVGACRKRTKIIGSFADLTELSGLCRSGHMHIWAWGSQKTKAGRSVERAQLAGRYPDGLCSALVATVVAGVARGAPTLCA